MDWGELSRYEWIVIELIVLGLLIAELVSIRRTIRRDREQRRADERAQDSEPPPDQSQG